jgi:thymidine kinase
MRGGLKVYRGSAAAARHYVEADRGRADDYYLAEGTGVAERYIASRVDGMRHAEPLTGDAYEAWVAGVDPRSGVPKGRLRTDDRAVRFVEVVVNGPKTWSLAAELHPVISVAYDAAQDNAARQIIGWLTQHATTRVGPRGAQVQMPVSEIDAVTVRHYTSRAGDPHRHLHLQINARVLADGRWRGLHTVGVRDSLDAINGIGHAAVMTDPAFRGALAAHGFTLDPGTGEVMQLAEFVGPYSARAAQISRNIDRYQTEWRTNNPGREAGPALRRTWDARAWADARPDKVVPRDGAELTQRWVDELRELGYRDPTSPVPITATTVGAMDRVQAVEEVLSRLGARRSGWNAADVRGEVEQLIARRNVVTNPAARGELAEDLTARTLADCSPLIGRSGVPEHIRQLTSRHVLDVEADLVARFAARAHAPSDAVRTAVPDLPSRDVVLDDGQRDAVRALAGPASLIVVEGAAGAGKTTVLAATRHAVARDGRRLMVVTPTRRAAEVAAREVSTRAFSASWLAHQHGYRWRDHGVRTRLAPGETDADTGAIFGGPSEAAELAAGDVLLVDEAGMLDQDTAQSLLTIADEHGTRVALIGDRHQLPAVGRGGVLDLAARCVDTEAHLTLNTVHRFARTSVSANGDRVTVRDDEYAALSLVMRAGADPVGVFNTLLSRGQIHVHDTTAERIEALAHTGAEAAAGTGDIVFIADTREQVAALNAAIRDHLVDAGTVDDKDAATTDAGQRIGVGDKIATRRNDTDLQVANRDQWTVTRICQDGGITVTGPRGHRALPSAYVREHVELAYASTAHGAQGDTVKVAHVVLGDHTTAAAAYVGMTRGREANVAHLVADDIEAARDQWIAVFGRDRADLGPAHAAEAAAREADRYAQPRPLDVVLDELRRAWTVEANAQMRLADARQRRALLRDITTIAAQRDATVPALKHAHEQARARADHTAARLRRLEAEVTARAAHLARRLSADWDAQREPARHAAQTIRSGPGRIGPRRAAVRDAREHLAHWSATWQPYLPTMPSQPDEVAGFAAWFDDTTGNHAHLEAYGRAAAEKACPEYLDARAAAQAAADHQSAARRDYRHADQHYRLALQTYGNLGQIDEPADHLARVQDAIARDEAQLDAARDRVAALRAEPSLRAQPSEILNLARAQWSAERDARAAWLAIPRAVGAAADDPDLRRRAVPAHRENRRSPAAKH